MHILLAVLLVVGLAALGKAFCNVLVDDFDIGYSGLDFLPLLILLDGFLFVLQYIDQPTEQIYDMVPGIGRSDVDEDIFAERCRIPQKLHDLWNLVVAELLNVEIRVVDADEEFKDRGKELLVRILQHPDGQYLIVLVFRQIGEDVLIALLEFVILFLLGIEHGQIMLKLILHGAAARVLVDSVVGRLIEDSIALKAIS